MSTSTLSPSGSCTHTLSSSSPISERRAALTAAVAQVPVVRPLFSGKKSGMCCSTARRRPRGPVTMEKEAPLPAPPVGGRAAKPMGSPSPSPPVGGRAAKPMTSFLLEDKESSPPRGELERGLERGFGLSTTKISTPASRAASTFSLKPPLRPLSLVMMAWGRSWARRVGMSECS